jgi:hypothetical protein
LSTVGQATDGSFIKLANFASPGLGRAYLPWKPGIQALYGAFPDPAGRLRVWGLDVSSGRWGDTQLVESATDPVGTRPALAWVPYQPNADYPGRLYIVWSDHHGTEPVTRMLMSYVRVQPQPDGALERTERIGLLSPFDNGWLYSYGSDLLFERSVDTNLRSVHAYAMPKERFQEERHEEQELLAGGGTRRRMRGGCAWPSGSRPPAGLGALKRGGARQRDRRLSA